MMSGSCSVNGNTYLLKRLVFNLSWLVLIFDCFPCDLVGFGAFCRDFSATMHQDLGRGQITLRN